MYIPEFWCGVLLTVVAEIVIVFVLIIYSCFRANGNGNIRVETEQKVD